MRRGCYGKKTGQKRTSFPDWTIVRDARSCDTYGFCDVFVETLFDGVTVAMVTAVVLVVAFPVDIHTVNITTAAPELY